MTVGDPVASPARANEAKRSVHYVLAAALRYGGVGSYADLLDQVGRLALHKPFNALLVLLQRPRSTAVLPAHHWEERYQRVIRPGEQPLVLLPPNGPVVFLFDVSQTEPLPRSRELPLGLPDPRAMRHIPHTDDAWQWMVSNAKADGVRVSDPRRSYPSAECIWHSERGLSQQAEVKRRPPTTFDVPVRYETLVNTALRPTERLCTLAHELGHLYCGHVGTHDPDLWPDRRHVSHPATEFDAESVARIVFRRLSPDVELPAYLDQFTGKGEPEPTVGVERVLTAAGRVIAMAEGWAPRRRRRTGAPTSEALS